MAVLFALISSLSWGTADFLGGLASRRVGSLRVLSVSYPAGGVLITILALLVVPGVLSSESMWVGVTSGAVGALGMGLLYAALAQGQMGIVSPITAVLSGAVPVLVGVIRGESLSPTAIAGILAAGLAVILVSRETGPHKKTPPRAIGIAIASGLAIGAYLSVLGSAPVDSGIWVATIGRWFSSILVVIALIIWLVRTGARMVVGGFISLGLGGGGRWPGCPGERCVPARGPTGTARHRRSDRFPLPGRDSPAGQVPSPRADQSRAARRSSARPRGGGDFGPCLRATRGHGSSVADPGCDTVGI